MPSTQIAYLHGRTLRICARPCNGAEYQTAETITVAGKREARAICKARGVTPWNF